MALPVSELFIAAGYASSSDPLFDSEETWTHVMAEVQETPEFLALGEPQQIIVIGTLHAAHLRDRSHNATNIAVTAGSEDDMDNEEIGDDNADDEGNDEGNIDA
jgi:hypothetical protein